MANQAIYDTENVNYDDLAAVYEAGGIFKVVEHTEELFGTAVSHAVIYKGRHLNPDASAVHMYATSLERAIEIVEEDLTLYVTKD